MISLEEKLFRLDDKKRATIIDILSNPTVQQAFSILTQVPSREPSFVAGVPLDTTIAHEFCKMVGANSVMRGLVRMTHAIDKSPEEVEDRGEEEPFEHLKEQYKAPVPVVPRPPAEIEQPKPKRPYNRKK